MAGTPGTRKFIWTDNATRFEPVTPSPEEDAALIALALEHQPAASKVEVGKLLLERAHLDPDRLFFPTLWVKEELQAQGRTR